MYHYKPADVACEYCVNSRRRRCRESGCPWLAERIEAGVVSYASAVRELFGGVEDEAFIKRLGLLVLHFRGSFWLDREHEYNTRLLLRSVGYQAWRNPRFFASLYLFGSNRALMKRAWNACMPGGFEPMYMVMRGVSEHDYTLIQAAKALMCGGLGLGLSVIQNPRRYTHPTYDKWLGDKKPLSHRDVLRAAIDDALARKPETFDELLQLICESGYRVSAGKNITFY